MPKSINEALTEKVVPSGVLRHLALKEIQPSRNNPRVLFDSAPLAELRANIKELTLPPRNVSLSELL